MEVITSPFFRLLLGAKHERKIQKAFQVDRNKLRDAGRSKKEARPSQKFAYSSSLNKNFFINL